APPVRYLLQARGPEVRPSQVAPDESQVRTPPGGIPAAEHACMHDADIEPSGRVHEVDLVAHRRAARADVLPIEERLNPGRSAHRELEASAGPKSTVSQGDRRAERNVHAHARTERRQVLTVDVGVRRIVPERRAVECLEEIARSIEAWAPETVDFSPYSRLD